MTKTVAQAIQEVDTILTRAKADSVKALTVVMTQEPRADQIYACLELFHTQNYELVYNAFSNKKGKLFTEYACMPGFDGRQSFLPELVSYFQNLWATAGWSEEQMQDFMTQHEPQFSQWFKSVWQAAGGETAKIPVYFCFEKEYRVQNVMTGVVMDELEAAQALGHNITDVLYA